jgi:BphX-like protein
MQIVGAFYVLQFVMMVLVRAPIRTFGPNGTLSKAAAGDTLARFVVDTWTIFGLEVGAVGVMLLIATRRTELAAGAIWTVLAIEVGRGLIADTYMIARGIHVGGYLVWIVIHSVVIVTGLLALRARRRDVHVPATPGALPV